MVLGLNERPATSSSIVIAYVLSNMRLSQQLDLTIPENGAPSAPKFFGAYYPTDFSLI